LALKDLLVYVDQSEHAFDRLRLAGDLAYRHGARLTAIYVRELNPTQMRDRSTAELGRGSTEAIDRTNQHIRMSIDDVVERLHSALRDIQRERGLEVEWRCLDGFASTIVAQHARFSDLCILSQEGTAAETATGYTFSEKLLFVTGRPVVFIPTHGGFATLGRNIVVAWNSSRAAARAVNDALPLIECAERVTVIAANPHYFVDRYGGLPPERIVEHLRRHGASVEGIWLEDIPAHSIVDALQAEANKLGADLVIAGAFGQPKLWERLMGGVTHGLLARMRLPLLMSY
jgi:nucleotide-binding universal stress UspA family protein